MKLSLIAFALLILVTTLWLKFREIRRRNTAEAAMFRVLGTEAGPILWNGFPPPGGYKVRR